VLRALTRVPFDLCRKRVCGPQQHAAQARFEMRARPRQQHRHRCIHTRRRPLRRLAGLSATCHRSRHFIAAADVERFQTQGLVIRHNVVDVRGEAVLELWECPRGWSKGGGGENGIGPEDVKVRVDWCQRKQQLRVRFAEQRCDCLLTTRNMSVRQSVQNLPRRMLICLQHAMCQRSAAFATRHGAVAAKREQH
jgi:hypothetical protein